MNGQEFNERMMRLIERLEREPRFALAWELAYRVVLREVEFLPGENWPKTIEEASAKLITEIRETSSLARMRRRTRGINALLDRIARLNRGEKLPDRRRPRRRNPRRMIT